MSFLKRIIAIILVILAVIFAVFSVLAYAGVLAGMLSGTMLATFGSVGWGVWATLGLLTFASSYMLDPDIAEKVTEAAKEVAQDIGEIGGAIGGGLVDGVGTVVNRLFANPLILIGGGVMLWWLLSPGDKDQQSRVVISSGTSDVAKGDRNENK